MDVNAYLERIGYRGGREPTAANLAALVKTHRMAVPYETLDLWRRRKTTLELGEIYDKIVIRHRGGYCFELNGLFAWLLRALGYNVREYFGRWILGEPASTVPMRRHRVVCVAIPGVPNQLVDVGIGLPFMFSPLDFAFDVSQLRNGRIYRVVRNPTLRCVVELRKGVEWVPLFSFDTEPQLPIDFEYAHWWCETHPESSFLSGLWVFRPFPDGGSASISLEEDPERPGGDSKRLVLAHFDSRGGMTRKILRDETALAAALLADFGIKESRSSMETKGMIAHVRGMAAKALASVVCLVAAASADLSAAMVSTNEGLVKTANEPVSVTELKNGHWILDFGRNAAGWLQFVAPKTGEYKIIAGELLNADGTVNTRDADSKWNCYYTWVTNPADGKDVKTSVRYIAVESSVTEVGTHRVPFNFRWQKRFDSAATVKTASEIGSITTFRYVEIVTPPPGVSPKDFRRVMVHHDFDWNESSFESSDETLNQVYDLCKWSVYADSYLGYWVDGDRERKLYEADQYTIQNAAFGVFSDNAVTHRSTKALMDNVWSRNGILEWAQFIPLLIHNDWFLSGDTSIPSGYWAKIPKCGQHTSIFTEYELENGLIAPPANDWPSIVDHPPCYHYGYDMKNSGTGRDDADGRLLPIENALHYAQHRAMAEMATALGKASEAAAYAAKADKIYQSYNATFFDAEAGLYRDKLTTNGYVSTHHSTLANAYALAFDLVPADRMAHVANYVATNQVPEGMACSTYAAHYVLEGLCKAGRVDAAIAYMTATNENSWVNMMREGLTTAGEAWSLFTSDGANCYDLSHAWGCAPAYVIPRYVLGVRPAAPGWAKAVVVPQFGSLTRARGRVPTAKGSVTVDYSDGTLKVTVPAGLEAEVRFAGQTKTVAANAAERTVTIAAPKRCGAVPPHGCQRGERF